jgi:hypothetical protein
MNIKQQADSYVEMWKDIPDYEGIYQVSSFGNIKVLDRNYVVNGVNMVRKSKILKISTNKNGYKTITLCKNSIQKTYNVHRLVAIAFLGDSDMQVDHINGDKLNNNVSNLRYVSARFNSSFGAKKGIENKSSKFRGVYLLKSTNKWRSIIWHNGKRVSIGCFDNEKDASIAYNNFAGNLDSQILTELKLKSRI